VSGGPNSGLQDPYVQAAGLAGCAPEKCFVDNIEAWSANEIAINWNTPLAWVAAFLDEKGEGKATGGKGKKAKK
jgi:endoglucanase